MNKVAAVKVVHYTPYEAVEQGVREALELLGGLQQLIKHGDTVLLKPNMLEALPPEKAVTTHPEVVRAVIREVKKAGGIPVVGDSPAMGNTRKTAKETGIMQVCLEEGAEILPFQTAGEFFLEDGHVVKKFSLAKELGEVDKVISLAKMKTHSFTGVTGGIKNLFGFVIGAEKAQFHLRLQRRGHFAAMLVDLARLVKPTLFVIDGVVGMEANGPRNGQPINSGVILAGENGFAVDMVMTDIMGFNPETLPVTAKALELGLVPSYSAIQILGSAKDLRLQFKAPENLEALEDRIPKWAASLGQRQLTARPIINNACVGCGRCVAHCPPGAMAVRGSKVEINHSQCIRCYCCQEVCPHNAVDLHEGLLLRMVKSNVRQG